MVFGAVGDFTPRSARVWRSQVGPRREQSRNVPVAAAVSLLGVPKKRSFPFMDIEGSLDFYPAGLGDDFWVGHDTAPPPVSFRLGFATRIDPCMVSLLYRGL